VGAAAIVAAGVDGAAGRVQLLRGSRMPTINPLTNTARQNQYREWDVLGDNSVPGFMSFGFVPHAPSEAYATSTERFATMASYWPRTRVSWAPRFCSFHW